MLMSPVSTEKNLLTPSTIEPHFLDPLTGLHYIPLTLSELSGFSAGPGPLNPPPYLEVHGI